MKTFDQQQYILQLLQKAENKTMSKGEIVSAICKLKFDNRLADYYYNASKHIGAMLTRMVESKLIHRPKKGHYSIGYVDNKTNLFNQK